MTEITEYIQSGIANSIEQLTGKLELAVLFEFDVCIHLTIKEPMFDYSIINIESKENKK